MLMGSGFLQARQIQKCVWDPQSGHVISEELIAKGGIMTAEFNRTNDRILVTDSGGGVGVWEMPHCPHPGPAWLADLLEAMAGERLDADGGTHVVPVSALVSLRDQLL